MSETRYMDDQEWVKEQLSEFWDGSQDYADSEDRTILGEDEHGFILAAYPLSDEWWEPFDSTKKEHREALKKTLEVEKLNFLVMGYDGES